MPDDITGSTPDAPQAPQAPNDGAPRHPRTRKLTDAERQYVIRRLAAHDSPTAIAQDVSRRFGIRITRQAVVNYDPTRMPDCAPKWADAFIAARDALAGARSDRLTQVARTERLLLQAIEQLAARILTGGDADGRKAFAKRPEDISDDDRLRALTAFVLKQKALNPAGYAAMRRALLEEEAPDAG